MFSLRAAVVPIALAGAVVAAASARPARAPRVDFFTALGLNKPAPDDRDVWQVTGPPADNSAPFAWMSAAGPLPGPDAPSLPIDAFQQLLDRIADDGPRWGAGSGGSERINHDPGRLRYQFEKTDSLHYRRLRLEVPDAAEVRSLPYGARDWKAEDRYRVPIPIPVPTAEQMFVYGQLNGSGDSLNTLNTSLTGKTGLGVKWSLVGRSEVQLKSGALFSYSDVTGWSRNPDRAKPAVEVVATVPLVGPWSFEYTGSALPAVSRADPDQIRQEVRFALPLRGDGEFEFGARYQWLDTPQVTPWVDRAQLFLGVKFRH